MQCLQQRKCALEVWGVCRMIKACFVDTSFFDLFSNDNRWHGYSETRRERPKSAPYLRLKYIQGTTIGNIWKKNDFFPKKVFSGKIFSKKVFF